MHLHSLGEQIRGRFIAGVFRNRKNLTGRPGDCLMPRHHVSQHRLGIRDILLFRNDRQIGIRMIS